MSEKYMIALDVGGTKADAVLFKQDGEIITHLIEPGGTPFDHGFDRASDNCISTVKKLIGSTDKKINNLFASIATVEYYYDRFIKKFNEEFKDIEKLRIEGDGTCLISGMLGHNDGASMICGTGSSLYMRKGDNYTHIGGGGHMIDSCGSGYALGRLALQASLRTTDGSSSPTLIAELIREKCGGMEPWNEQVTVYAKGRSYVASFAETVFEARRQGDVVARRIFTKCAQDIADVIWAARKRMGGPFDIVFNGGIFSNFPEYANAVCALAPEDINVIFSNVPPAYGCAVEAMYDAGFECNNAFKERFLSTYEATKPKKN